MKIDAFYQKAISKTIGTSAALLSSSMATGGMINNSVILHTDQGAYFLKWNNDANCDDLFKKESLGLQVLKQGPLKIPEVLGHGQIEDHYFLMLEHIAEGQPDLSFWEIFGIKLAALHRITSDQFGFETDNHIGKLTQYNSCKPDWADFFINNRLLPQLELGYRLGTIDSTLIKSFEKLFPKLDRLFPREKPSLIHGDLWSGNFTCDTSGKPVIFDPATYFANREIEIAFTKLFGGFNQKFYKSYHNCFSLETGFNERVELYNLYPLLVHVNLFGSSYLNGILQTLKRFV